MRSLVLVLTLHCISSSVRWTLAEHDCEFYYSEQPPAALDCDPWRQSELKMECTVRGPVHADFQLVWFSMELGPEAAGDPAPAASMMRNSSNATIRFQLHQDAEAKSIRSRLQLHLDRAVSAGDTAFWCSVLVQANSTDGRSSGSPRTLASEAFVLRAASVYADLPVCGGTPQSSETGKCASASGSLLQPASPPPPLPPPTPSATSATQALSAVLPTSPHSAVSSSSQKLKPRTSVLADPPLEDLREGQAGLGAIMFPILGTLAGAIGTLSLLACLYLHCHYKHKKGEATRKQTVEATYHSYSLPSTLSSHQLKGRGSLPFSPSSASLPTSRRARSLKLEESLDASVHSHDQYVEMAGADWGCRRAPGHASCPTLQRTGLPSSLSNYGSFKQGFSYEVPVPFHLEPEYASIPCPYVPYLIPIQTNMEPGLQKQNSQIQRLQSLQGQFTHPPMSAPASPTSHDYEEVIHTAANKAYRELRVVADRDPGSYTALVPLPSAGSKAEYSGLSSSAENALHT